MELRRYRSADEAAVWALHMLGLRQSGADLGARPWDDDLHAVEAVYLANHGEFLVGEDDGHVIAMGALKRTSAERAEIKRMRVHPNYQRRGYGARILRALEGRARELGYHTLHLDTSTVQVPALHLYRQHGFVETHRKTVKGLELIFMEKSLT